MLKLTATIIKTKLGDFTLPTYFCQAIFFLWGVPAEFLIALKRLYAPISFA